MSAFALALSAAPAAADIFGDWDADGDAGINEGELNQGVFGSYDRDESGEIDETEFGDLDDDLGDHGLFDL
ncbi:hypothetical protein [Marinimicrococcus flavescens]|uniref:EF-hand domain-containing protein n=1 Tax=Marinimicrococcus flavescens TaxID=3031815 RepID=A0AAP3V0V3_9PROT|nr:hypothetical protein [Marinimicrococcus flavescens]